MDKINLDAMRGHLAERNGTENYIIAMALLAIAQELREMNQRATIGNDPEFTQLDEDQSDYRNTLRSVSSWARGR